MVELTIPLIDGIRREMSKVDAYSTQVSNSSSGLYTELRDGGGSLIKQIWLDQDSGDLINFSTWPKGA